MSKKERQKQIKSQKVPPKKVLFGKQTFNDSVYLIACILVTILIFFIRFGLIGVPLERDEGEYAYFGKLILEGVAPYKTAYNMKLPGTYVMYSLFMGVFGTNISGIHFGLTIMNAATMLFLFFGFRKLFNGPIALLKKAMN